MAGPQQKRNRLRKARLAKGLSQFQLAEEIGVDEKSVQRWESGKSTPRPSMLRVLCDTLAMTPEELDFGDPEEAQPGEEDQPTLQQRGPCQEKPRATFPLQAPFWKRASLLSHRQNFHLLSGIIIMLMALLVGGVVIVAFPLLPVLGQSDCGHPFSGVFHGQLDARWHWDNPTEGARLRWSPQGPLSIAAPTNSDLNLTHKNLNAPRLLQSITGDFTIQTHLQVYLTRNFQSAGLLFWQDSTKFLHFERAFGKENGLLLSEDVDGSFILVGKPTNALTSAQSLDLRVQKHGDHFTASWWEPGHPWHTYGEADLHFDRLMVGLDVLAVYGAPQTTATFTSFMVSCT